MPYARENFCNRKNFSFALEILRYHYPEHVFIIENTYLDYGAGMKWDTIICYRNNNGKDSYQMLCPRDWDKLYAAGTSQEILTLVLSVIKDQKTLLER